MTEHQRTTLQRIHDDIRREAIIAEVYRCLAEGVQPSREICAEYKVLYDRKNIKEKTKCTTYQ